MAPPQDRRQWPVSGVPQSLRGEPGPFRAPLRGRDRAHQEGAAPQRGPEEAEADGEQVFIWRL